MIKPLVKKCNCYRDILKCPFFSFKVFFTCHVCYLKVVWILNFKFDMFRNVQLVLPTKLKTF